MSKKNNRNVIEREFEIMKDGLEETLVSNLEAIGIGQYLAPEKYIYTEKECEIIKDDFFRFHVFIHLFAGNIDYWLLYLETMASKKLRDETRPFVLHLKRYLERNPQLIDKIKEIILSEACDLKDWEEEHIALFRSTEIYKNLEKTKSKTAD